jgi:hypothetical protein
MSDQSPMPRTRRRVLAETLTVAAATVLGHGGLMGGPMGVALAQPPAPLPVPPWPKATFPLRIAAGQRHLEDAAGQPFLLHGDAAWSLIAQLTREDAQRYLDDRQARGFNAILVNIIEHRFAGHAPANAYGHQPFLTPGDFATPNETYFAHADWVVRQAADRGILVMLAPAYLGYGGGDDGWYRAMVANGPATLGTYGRYLGRRYGRFTNILWVHGGDFDPPRKELVRAVAEGIREHDRGALHTAHCAPETAASALWQGEPWLQLDNVYTYGPVRTAALRQYARPQSAGGRMPFLLIESAYENEHGAGALRVRMQAWQALLAGACGHVYGNNPVWHFDGPGLQPAPTAWQAALASRGAQSMTHLRTLMESIPWWRLVPDGQSPRGGLVADGAASEQGPAAAATGDGMVAVAYLAGIRDVHVEMHRLRGPRVRLRWYDPSDGSFADAAGGTAAASGTQTVRPGGRNGAGHEDWVLLLEGHP